MKSIVPFISMLPKADIDQWLKICKGLNGAFNAALIKCINNKERHKIMKKKYP